jgi:hypothetical protein
MQAMKRILILIGALLLAVILVLGFWRAPVTGREVAVPVSGSESASASGAGLDLAAGVEVAGPAARPAVVIERVPVPGGASSDARASVLELPAADLPLRETATALIEAHRAGYLAATTRLLEELTDCQRFRWASLRMDAIIAFEDSPRARRGGDRMQEAMTSAAELVSELGERCADLPNDLDEALLFEVQRRAADAGDLAGQLGFALVPALSLNKALLQMDRLQVYREQAPQFLQRALEQGSGQAVAGFMDAYEHYFEGWRGHAAQGTEMQKQAMRKMIDAVRPLNPLQQVLGEDLVKAYTYATLCKSACNANDQARAETALVRLRVALDPKQRSDAEDAAAELYDANFGPRPRPDDIDLEALRDAILGFRR